MAFVIHIFVSLGVGGWVGGVGGEGAGVGVETTLCLVLDKCNLFIQYLYQLIFNLNFPWTLSHFEIFIMIFLIRSVLSGLCR